MTRDASPQHRSPVHRALGFVLLLHFAIQAWVKFDTGTTVDLLWLSHAALLMSAAGLLLDRLSLVAVALMWAAVPHAIWALDFAGLMFLGESRLGVLTYWPTADPAVRLGTSFHLYLVPVLLFVVARRGVRLRPWLPVGASAFLVLAVLSRALGSAAANVNWVYRVELQDRFGVVDAFNAQPQAGFVLAVCAVMAACLFWPTAIVVDAVTEACQPRNTGSRSATSAAHPSPLRT